MDRKNIVGKIINFRGLVYAPANENGVIYLFSKLSSDLNLYIETIRVGFPDCIAKRYIGKEQWEEVNIEFEYKSSSFYRHGHLQAMKKGAKCDMIVCWEHDWKDCPKNIEVLELKTEYLNFPNPPLEVPDKMNQTNENSLENHFKNYTLSKELYLKLHDRIVVADKNVWRKINKNSIFYYGPERVSFSIKIQKQGLRIQLFTSGKKMKGVETFGDGSYAQKWGVMFVKSNGEMPLAIQNIKQSLKLIRHALKYNEPTGWYSEVE